MAKGASALLKSSVSTFRSTALTRTSAGVCDTDASGIGSAGCRSRIATTTAAAISSTVPQTVTIFHSTHLASHNPHNAISNSQAYAVKLIQNVLTRMPLTISIYCLKLAAFSSVPSFPLRYCSNLLWQSYPPCYTNHEESKQTKGKPPLSRNHGK